MPSYAELLEENFSNKRKLEEYETVALTEECSAEIQNKLPIFLNFLSDRERVKQSCFM